MMREFLPVLSFLIYDLDSTLLASLWNLCEGKNHKVKKGKEKENERENGFEAT